MNGQSVVYKPQYTVEHNKTFSFFQFASLEPSGKINLSLDGVDKWIIEITSCEGR